MPKGPEWHVAYRVVLFAAALLVFGLVFRQIATLLLAVLVTVIIAIPLAAAADRLERRRVPRGIGALVALLGGVLTLGLIVALLVPPFVEQTNQFLDDVPAIVDDLGALLSDVTGSKPTDLGDRAEESVQDLTDDPAKLVGPIASVGISVAGIVATLILVLITAYYMAVRPDPLIDGLKSLVPPSRRAHAGAIFARLREAWVGWMIGLGADMLVTGVLLYIGLTIVGLDFAIFFAILSALLVVIPYFGSFIALFPPLLFALTDSPSKALVVLIIYLLVQQLESNVIIPMVMSQRVKLHPAVIAVGVVIVGQLFGFVGLFVAVPILSLLQISVDEMWVKPLEDRDRLHAMEPIELPSDPAVERP